MHGVPPMVWDAAVATNAQAYATKTNGVMVHSTPESRILNGIYHGENLAKGATDSYAVDLWYSEISLTAGGKGLVSAFDEKVGHYTQVVWKDSVRLGCGTFNNLLVCQYGPGGNIYGQFAAKVLAPSVAASQC